MTATLSLLLIACAAKDAVDLNDTAVDTGTVDTTGSADDTASGGVTDDTEATADDTGTAGADDTGTGGTDDTAATVGDDTGDTGSTGGTTVPDVAVDYRVSGSFSVSESSTTISTATCDVDVTVFTPDGGDGPLVVLGHGYLRAGANMLGWGEHYASWGFTVAVPDLCHSVLWDTDHQENGEDMVDIAAALGGPAIYAGQSAGGLAALVAGASDPDALGVVGLDAVDASDLGLDSAGDVSAPVYGTFGESSLCNANNNGVSMYAAASDYRSLRVTEADHCDFESDTDWLCTLTCEGSNDAFSNADIQDAIRGLTTAAMMELSGADVDSGWWAPGGEYYDALDAEGAISGL